jgi:hypothetical protein
MPQASEGQAAAGRLAGPPARFAVDRPFSQSLTAKSANGLGEVSAGHMDGDRCYLDKTRRSPLPPVAIGLRPGAAEKEAPRSLDNGAPRRLTNERKAPTQRRQHWQHRSRLHLRIRGGRRRRLRRLENAPGYRIVAPRLDDLFGVRRARLVAEHHRGAGADEAAAFGSGFGSVPEEISPTVAMLQMDTAPPDDPLAGPKTQSLWQVDCIATMLKLRCAWIWRADNAVAWIQGASW